MGLLYLLQFPICIHWYFVLCANSFYLLVHRYNRELHHQEIARGGDVMVFESSFLSSSLAGVHCCDCFYVLCPVNV
jgi:hypothetical protein